METPRAITQAETLWAITRIYIQGDAPRTFCFVPRLSPASWEIRQARRQDPSTTPDYSPPYAPPQPRRWGHRFRRFSFYRHRLHLPAGQGHNRAPECFTAWSAGPRHPLMNRILNPHVQFHASQRSTLIITNSWSACTIHRWRLTTRHTRCPKRRSHRRIGIKKVPDFPPPGRLKPQVLVSGNSH